MKVMTKQAVETLLCADNTVPVEYIHDAMEALEGRSQLREPKKEILPEFCTVTEACQFLRVCRMTLYRLQEIGHLKSCHVAGKKLFRRADLLAVVSTGS